MKGIFGLFLALGLAVPACASGRAVKAVRGFSAPISGAGLLTPAAGSPTIPQASLAVPSLDANLVLPDALPQARALTPSAPSPVAAAEARPAAASRPRRVETRPAGTRAGLGTVESSDAEGERRETIPERLEKTELKTADQFRGLYDGAGNAADEGGRGWTLVPSGVRKWWNGRRARTLQKRRDRRAFDTAPFGAEVTARYRGRTVRGRLIGVDRNYVTIAASDGKKSKWKRSRLSEAAFGEPAAVGGVPERARARFDSRRGYYRFLERDVWGEVGPGVGSEIEALRRMGDPDARKARLRRIGEEIVARIKRKSGAREIGFHYNLHGGSAEGYAAGGGIRAGRGDITLQYSTQGDLNYKVYLFRSNNVGLYDVLSESNPNLVSARMGSVLNLFDSDSEGLEGFLRQNEISIDFEEAALFRTGMVGIPYSRFLAPPLEPFAGRAGRRFGLKGRLSKDEETLAAMRYIEAAVLGPF
jgi:hypothetical protein